MTRAGKTLRIRDGRGVLILDHQGIGNVVMSIPLLRAVSEWARDRWPVWVTLEGPARAQVLAQEGLNIIPIYYQPKCNAWERLSALRAALQGRVDLVSLEGPARAQVLAQEGLNIIPIYYQPKCNAWERLSALRAALQGRVDLV